MVQLDAELPVGDFSHDVEREPHHNDPDDERQNQATEIVY